MSDKKKTAGGPSIRLAILTLILLVLGAIYCHDRFVSIPAIDATIAKMQNEQLDVTQDQHPQIWELAGCKPATTEKVNDHEFENFEFGRILPFMEPRLATVVYLNDKVVEIIPGGIPENERGRFKERIRHEYPVIEGSTAPGRAGGGGGMGGAPPASGGEDKADDEKEGADKEGDSA